MTKPKMTPPLNDEGMETKLVSLALRQAQKQLEDGTASSQVMTHFLKLGSIRAQVDLEQTKLQNKLLEEKILAERSEQQISEMIAEVLAAFKSYSAPSTGDFNDDPY